MVCCNNVSPPFAGMTAELFFPIVGQPRVVN
jgi:hypothetical protein